MGNKGVSVMKLILHRLNRRWKLRLPFFCSHPLPAEHSRHCMITDHWPSYFLSKQSQLLILNNPHASHCQCWLGLAGHAGEGWTWEHHSQLPPKESITHSQGWLAFIIENCWKDKPIGWPLALADTVGLDRTIEENRGQCWCGRKMGSGKEK